MATENYHKLLGIVNVILIVLILTIVLGLGSWDDPMPAVTFIIFFSVLVSIIFYWRQRIPIVLGAIALLLALGILTVTSFIEYANINVIAFLLGMMIVIAFLEEKGFFDALLGILMSKFGGSAKSFFIATLILSAVSAALIDEVSSILFMCAIVLKAAKKYEVNPTPFILSVVFATNVGSSFTVIGNPVGILIAFQGNLTFFDFLVWSLPIGLAVLGVTILLTLWLFRKDLAKMDEKMKLTCPVKTSIYRDLIMLKEMRVPLLIFAGTIIGLIIHHPLESLLGIEKNTLLLGIPLIAAGLALMQGKEDAGRIIETRVQWPTLVFLLFFFGVAGALESSGVTVTMASNIQNFTGGNSFIEISTFLWVSGIMSAVMDNVLAVATISPIVATMTDSFPLWWAVLFGACFMGNLTIIGSSANIVAHNYYEKNSDRTITFFEWLKYGSVVAIAQMLVAMAMLLLIHVYLFPGAGA